MPRPISPVRRTCSTALLLIDVINDLEFPGNETMIPDALRAAERIRHLRSRARELDMPVIYVNDNFDHWRSNFQEITTMLAEQSDAARRLVDLLAPADDEYFVLKPRHSAFYNTTLETLLKYLQVERLILTGFSGHVCILMTASDAYIREFGLFVPRDCIASPSVRQNDEALRYMADVFDVDTGSSEELDLAALVLPTRSVAEMPVDDVP